MLLSQKEKEKQQSSIVALQSKPQESANPWSKYGSLVEKDNIADEDGVIDLLADNLLVDPSTGGVIKVDPALLSWKKQTLAAGKTTDTNTDSSENAAKPQAQSGIIAQAVQPKHSGVGKILGGRGSNTVPKPIMPTVAQKPQSAKTTILQSQAKEQISGVQPKQDEKNGWDTVSNITDTFGKAADIPQAVYNYDDAAKDVGKWIDKSGSRLQKPQKWDDLVKQLSQADYDLAADIAKKFNTKTARGAFGAMDVSSMMVDITNDLVSQKRISRATGDKLAKYFMTEVGIKVASRAIAGVAGTVTVTCPALVTIGGVATVLLASYAIGNGVDKIYDFFSSGEAEAYFQKLGQDNYARFMKEQAEWDEYLKKNKQQQEEWNGFIRSLDPYAEAAKKEMKEPIINGLKAIDNKAQEMGQENFKLLPQEMQQGAKLFEEMYPETAKAMGYEI